MSGIFDLHTVVATKRGVAQYLGDATAFASLFTAVDPAVVTEWRDALNATGVQVLTGFDQSPPQPPFALVTLESETPGEGFLGDVIGRDDDGAELRGMYVMQNVAIGTWTKSPELTRALAVVVRAAMLQAVPAFLAAGYDSVDYQGVDQLTMEERLIAEAGGMAVRTQRWRGRSLVCSRDPAGPPASISWWVQAYDLTVDGEAGGVVPSAQ